MTAKGYLDYTLFKNLKIIKSYKKSTDYELLVKEHFSTFFFQNKTESKRFFTTSSARSSLNIIFKTLALKQNSEVLVLGHTCSEVPNILIINKLKPVYCDIDLDSLCFEKNDLLKKINKKTKAVIIQHHLGVCNLDQELIALFKKKNILIVEDCALALGSSYNKIKAGTIGDFSVFSFGKSKTFNSYIGGMILVNDCDKLGLFQNEFASLGELSDFKYFILKIFFFIECIVYNSIFFYVLYPLMIFLKIFLKIFKYNYHISSVKLEIQTQKFDFKLPNFFNFLIFNYSNQIEDCIKHKNQKLLTVIKKINKYDCDNYIPEVYRQKHYYICSNRLLIIKKNGYKNLLTKLKFNKFCSNKYNFYSNPVDGNIIEDHYKKGSCPNSEFLCKNMIQIPI